MRIPSAKSFQHYNDCIDGQMIEQMCPEGQQYLANLKKCELFKKYEDYVKTL